MELRKCCNHPYLFTHGMPPPGEQMVRGPAGRRLECAALRAGLPG
jgi:hypothetical protein